MNLTTMRLNKVILSLVVGVAAGSVASAQTGVASGTQWGMGQDSIRCRQNLSLFSSAAKAQNYQEALAPWKAAYAECPASSKNIYIYGAAIIKWQISQEQDATKRKALIEDLMKLYDDRMQYFGDDPRYGRDVILSYKITDYSAYYGEEADYEKIYNWSKEAIELAKENAIPQLFTFFTHASQVLARRDTTRIETYINDYLMTSELLDKQYVAAEGNDKLREAAEANKEAVDRAFAESGLAGCDILRKVYTVDKVNARKDDKAYLESTCNLFVAAGCDDDVYYTAARHLFQIEPNAKAAMGLAGNAVRERNFSEAQNYLEKAIEYATSNNDKLKCYELMASIAMQQGNYSTARSAANNALQLNPKSGRSMITIARLLASSAGSIFPDDKVKQRAVYFLVIDRLRAAASADPSVTREANSLISQYSQMLPSGADIFMHPELNRGESFTVPGYGTTTIR